MPSEPVIKAANARSGNWTLVDLGNGTAALKFCGQTQGEPLPYDDPALYDPESEDAIRAQAERDAANGLLLRMRKGQQREPVPVP